MTAGRLVIVGLGPGDPDLITPAAQQALRNATDLVGYRVYLDRVSTIAGRQRQHAFDNRQELERARFALGLAQAGRSVAVVSGGDPGVFAMAAAVFEAIESGAPEWADLDITVEPGVTAMLAAAAHAGAPMGADFCAISLSDNLKSWATIERRLTAAAEADFVIALYNPASRSRPDLIVRALDVVRAVKPAATLVTRVRAAGTVNVERAVCPLDAVEVAGIDMRTLVIIGSSRTRMIPRSGDRPPWVYTPRAE